MLLLDYHHCVCMCVYACTCTQYTLLACLAAGMSACVGNTAVCALHSHAVCVSEAPLVYVRTYVCVTLHPVWETFCHDTLTHCWNCRASESALLAIFSVKTRLAVAPPKFVPSTPHALPVRETATVCGVRQNNGVCSLSTILRYSLLDSAWDGWIQSVQVCVWMRIFWWWLRVCEWWLRVCG